ncbi:Hepatocyte growth factor activator [Salix suchowensis]|nr:Hepatocyte growth factor activator [Salix suchowensis]
MEDYSRLKKNFRNQQSLGTAEKTVTSQARQSVDMMENLKPGKPNLSYADLHREITKKVDNLSSKPLTNHQKQCRMAIEEEELVKYMSKLPTYLERGQTRQEKVLNVGVLDWGRLEKWQCRQKQMPARSSRHSLSSSDSSSPLSTEGSSACSSGGQSCSPGHQKTCRPSLQSHLMSSSTKGNSPVKERIDKFQDVKGSQASCVRERAKFTREDQPFAKNHPEIILDQCNRKDTGPMINLESGALANGLDHEGLKCTKTKMKTKKKATPKPPEGDFLKRAEILQEQKANVDQTNERLIRLIPRVSPQGTDSGVSLNLTMMSGQKEEAANQRSLPDMPTEIFCPPVCSDVPYSSPVPCENGRHPERKCRSIDAEKTSFLPDSSKSVPHQVKIRMSPSRDTISKVEKPTVMLTDSSSKEPSVADKKTSNLAAEKVRSTSPFRRLSSGMSKISKNLSSKEGSSKPQLSSTSNFAQSGSEIAMASTCQENRSSDMQNATIRARSSPLRRLLDPMLKPKATNFHPSVEQLQRGSISTDKVRKSSSVHLDCMPGTAQFGKVKSDKITPCTISVSDSSKDKKHTSSAFQALLRVAVKNGQPMFTFAVDNERDILAATRKKLSATREDDYSCIYTFFAIHEAKKKNARWINQGGKGKGHDYIPNVVAQLKVSGSQFSNLTSQNYMAQSFAREFVLFAMDLQRAEQQQTLDFQPNEELAAIVVKIPEVINRSTIRDGNRTNKCNNLSEARCNSTSGNVQNQPILGSQNLINTTVILPSGSHSLPNKGGPSSLLQRWRSGGSCDCGGWDLGCKLRILVNQNQINKKSSPTKAYSAMDKFELVSQCGEENQPVFIMVPFKEGIYSVEFNTSLSTLQAFSLCIAVLDGKKLREMSESSNLFGEKTSLETILSQNDGTRAPNGIVGEVPARYVSYPPLSPVGRV